MSTENQNTNNSNNDPKWTSGATPSEEKGTSSRNRAQSMKKSFFLERLTHSDPVAPETLANSQGSTASQTTTDNSSSPKPSSSEKKKSPASSQSSPSSSKSSKEGSKNKSVSKSSSFIQEKQKPERNIIYQGALTKMGKVRQNWLLRWFVLEWTDGDKPKLTYYPSHIDMTPLGQIVLDKSTQITEDDSKNKPFCFRIEREHARTFYLCGSCDEDKAKWMNTLTQTIRQLRKHSEFFSLVGIYNSAPDLNSNPPSTTPSPRISQMVSDSQMPYVRNSKQASKGTVYEPPAVQMAEDSTLTPEERKKLLTRQISVPLDLGSQLAVASPAANRKNWKSGIPEEKNVVLIYGLNFVVGHELIRLLTDPQSTWHARIAIRDDVRFPPMTLPQIKLLEARGAEIVTINFDLVLSNRGSLEVEEANDITSSQNANIFVGVKKVLIFCELGQTSDLLPEMHQLISESKKFKVKHVIKCSYMGCEKWHRFAENRILKCGLNTTIIHHNGLMQSFLVDGVKQTGMFSLPLKPTTQVSWLHARDLALALLQVVMSADEHFNKVYTLTGSQSINCQSIEAYISKAAKKSVKFSQVSEEETLKQLTEVAELPEWLASSYTEYFKILVTASDQTQDTTASTPQVVTTAQVCTDINALIGRKPITFEEFSEEDSSIKVFREPYLFYFDEQSEELKSLYNQFDRMRTIGTARAKSQPFSNTNAGAIQTLIHDTVVDKSSFVRCMNLILGTDQIGEPLWRAFVKMNPNKLSFKEYAAGVGKLAKGKPDEVLDFGFRMYEENELINESQFLDICKALHRLATNKPLDEKKTEYLQTAFRSVAKERTRVGQEDFIVGFKRDKQFLETLGAQYLSNPSAVRLKTNFRKQSITFGHENWDLAEAVTIGIYTSMQDKKPANVTPGEVTMEQRSPLDYCIRVPATSQTPSINLCPEDFDSTQHVIIERESAVPFTDYAPNAFRKIRESCGISDEEYMASFSPENLFGTLEEVISTGRSGSFFFRTKDKKYLLKTLPPEEAQLLMKSLFDYTMYIIKNPHTFMVRFFGHHKLVYQKRDIYFVVMANVFHTNLPIHEQYDLKGSTLGRHVDVDATVSDLSEIALKDLNFDRKLYLDSVLKTRMLEQLDADTKFMEERNICDYSLLVGIHYMDRDAQQTKITKKSSAVSMFQYDDGGIQARTEDQGMLREVYFFGIVDILTLYDLKKKSEHAIKQILYLTPDNAISAIPPAPYRERFMKYVASILETGTN